MSNAALPAQSEPRRRKRGELEGELTAGQVANFEQRAERLRRHPEKGMTWEKVRAELKKRGNKSRAVGK